MALIHAVLLTTAAAQQNPVAPPAESTKAAPRALDVILTADGAIEGKLVDAQGHPAAGAKLLARQSAEPAIVAVSDAEGHFRLRRLTPGVYTIVYRDQSMLLRAWQAAAAPPAARPGVLLVAGNLQRGQLGDLNPLASSFTAQTFAVGILTAAVAVPLIMAMDEPAGS